jgi:hypothetical protein
MRRYGTLVMVVLFVGAAANVGVAGQRTEAKPKTVLIGGAFVSCDAAVELRNGELFRQYSEALARYDESQSRYDDTLKHFERRVAEAEKRWLKAAEVERRKLTADLIITAVGFGASRWLASVPDALSSQDKEALKFAVGRLQKASGMAVGAAYGDEAEARQVFSGFVYPLVLVVGAAIAPAAAPVAAAAAIITKGVNIAARLFDVWVLTFSAQQEFSSLAAAMKRVMASSPKADLDALNRIKNDIDGACGGR